MKLDTERALTVLEKGIRGRGCGKTTTSLSNVCNHLILGNNRIYCRVKNLSELRYLIPLFAEIVEDNNYNEDGLRIIHVSKARQEIKTTLGTIHFFSDAMQGGRFLLGREGLIVDLVDH